MRQKRVLRRAIDGLVMDGLVENIEIHGIVRVRCIRLTKFNPDFDASKLVGTTSGTVEIDRAEGHEIARTIRSR